MLGDGMGSACFLWHEPLVNSGTIRAANVAITAIITGLSQKGSSRGIPCFGSLYSIIFLLSEPDGSGDGHGKGESMKRAKSKSDAAACGRSLHPVVGIRTPRCNAAKQTAAIAVEHGGPEAAVVPFTVAARLEREVREAVIILKALLHDMPYPNCEWLHHRKADQNHAPTACPVEERINAAVERARLFIRNSNVRGQGTRHLVEGTLDPLVGGSGFVFDIVDK